MSSAIDVFREQREAADQLQARLTEISELLHQVQQQVNAVATNNEFRTVLRDEHNWLQQAQLVASQVRAFREEDVLRFWPGVVRRWIVALLFALGSAAAAGASYAWAMKPHAAELEELRSRLAFVEVVEHRFVTMTPAERRQFDALMKWNRSSAEHPKAQGNQRLRIPGITIAKRIRINGSRTYRTTSHFASRSNVNQRNRLRFDIRAS